MGLEGGFARLNVSKELDTAKGRIVCRLTEILLYGPDGSKVSAACYFAVSAARFSRVICPW
jgi:hypothetical protein